MKPFVIIAVLALSSMAFASQNETVVQQDSAGKVLSTTTIKSSYLIVSKIGRVRKNPIQTPDLMLELSDGSTLKITAKNGIEAGWLVNYFNHNNSDLESASPATPFTVTSKAPDESGKKKVEASDIDNFKMSVDGKTVGLDPFTDEFRGALADRGIYTDKEFPRDHSFTDLGEGLWDHTSSDGSRLVHSAKRDKRTNGSGDEVAPFPAGSDEASILAEPKWSLEKN